MHEEDDFADLERLERFIDGKERGVRLIDVLACHGIQVPSDEVLDDAALFAKLWDIIDALALLQVVLGGTDRLADRDLYRVLVNETLLEEMVLPSDPATYCHIVFLDDEGTPPCVDRDRLLPTRPEVVAQWH